jgi:hypothetical protein
VKEELLKCGPAYGDGITMYTPTCTRCFTTLGGARLVFSTDRLFESNEACEGMCPGDLYKTMSDSALVSKPIAQANITGCVLCTASHVIACNNTNCSAGYYLNDSCLECDKTLCNEMGYYRTKCNANSISDSRCARCGQELLYNQYSVLADVKLWKALNNSQLSVSRRFLSSSVSGPSVFYSEEGCALTCINNYAWIDFRTGLPPSSADRILRAHYGCIACSSTFFKDPAESLYSVWNHSGYLIQPAESIANDAFHMMQRGNVTGGCYACPANTDTISTVDIMCQTIPGFGKGVEAGQAVSITTVVINSETGMIGLKQSLFPSKKLPIAAVSSEVFFTCCGPDDSLCHTFEKRALDADQNKLIGPGTFYTRCMNATNRGRRLMASSQEIDQCLSGQYNHIRGGTTCFECPYGASTVEPYSGVDSQGKCACLPGYQDISNGGTLKCEVCGKNRHRTVHMSECEECPLGKITPSDASANCYCEEGTYALPNGTCALCEAGGYCESGFQRMVCPPNSHSEAGSKTRSDCVCNRPAYYGSLANPGSQCYKVPPTMQCPDECNCAEGWFPIYNTSLDKQTTVMRCMTECRLGQYATINPVTFAKLACVDCPLHTYSSSRQTIDAGDGRAQCTACPPNFKTLHRGSTSPSECQCLSGVINSTTSECGSCPANTYLNTFSNACEACPKGASSPAGSVGYISCMCGKGSRTTFNQDALQCEPCPKNTYASNAGFSCTPCPDGMQTTGTGSTSQRQCVCPAGKFNHAGLCF